MLEKSWTVDSGDVVDGRMRWVGEDGLEEIGKRCTREMCSRMVGRGETYTCFIWLGTMSLSLPTKAFPVARTRFSPLTVNGMLVEPVCWPERDHSVSP